jgi:uncharacterized NAD-dependent epimerase/dehydratase family protein
MNIAKPYLLFLGDAADPLAAKTAAGIAYWRPADCVGQLRLPGCNADLGLPDMDVADAVAQGARTLIVGVANRGGRFAPGWIEQFQLALTAGLDIASGLHNRLTDTPGLSEQAARTGRKLFDVRHSDQSFEVATGSKRTGNRLLTVGTDCSVGKMYTALAIDAELRRRGVTVTFRATGQTGILIAGAGVSVDAVVADFISGAVEFLAAPVWMSLLWTLRFDREWLLGEGKAGPIRVTAKLPIPYWRRWRASFPAWKWGSNARSFRLCCLPARHVTP